VVRKKISNKNISEALGVSPPSVSEMISKLLKDEYIDYISYKGVTLTELGFKSAMGIKRMHLLWEVFLVEKLGYNWEDVHEEVEILEHVTSPKLEKALDKYLDNPKFRPNGISIIGRGEAESIVYIPIRDLSKGERAAVRKFHDDKDILQYINKMNFKIGDKINLIKKDIDSKNLIIAKDEGEIDLESKFINNIYVQQL